MVFNIEELPLKRQELVYSQIDFYMKKHSNLINNHDELYDHVLSEFEKSFQRRLDLGTSDPFENSLDLIERIIDLYIFKKESFTESLEVNKTNNIKHKVKLRRTLLDKFFSKLALIIILLIIGLILVSNLDFIIKLLVIGLILVWFFLYS